MWTPKDDNALPTHDDITCAKEAIYELEAILECIVDVTEKAKFTKELETRKGWIAPIRKLPIEILSEIFICIGKIDSLGPVTITEVCRLWRNTILSTPRAWSFIDVGRKKYKLDMNCASIFIKQSDPCLFHIRIPRGDHYLHEFRPHPVGTIIVPYIHRIYCLQIPTEGLFDFGQGIFTNLRRLILSLGGGVLPIDPSIFCRSRFPCLEFLDCSNEFQERQTREDIKLPPLKYLSLRVDMTLSWCKVIQSCASTLRTLQIVGDISPIHGTSIAPFRIPLPLLDTLETVVETDDIPLYGAWPLEIMAPALRFYDEYVWGTDYQLLHGNVGNVVCLQTHDISRLSQYTALRKLQIFFPSEDAHRPSQLAQQICYNALTCPDLGLIQIPKRYQLSPGVQSMKQAIEMARPNIRFEFPEEMSLISGSMEAISVSIVDQKGCLANCI